MVVSSDPDCLRDLEPHWDALVPAEARLGPFPLAVWSRLWWRHFGDGSGLRVATTGEGEGLEVVAPLYLDGDSLLFVGGRDVTDYTTAAASNDRAGIAARLVLEVAAHEGLGLHCVSTPDELGFADALEEAASDLGFRARRQATEPAPYLELPDDMATYLSMLDGKERHELRRKLRRFERELGPPSLRRSDQATLDQHLALFFAWHRKAPGDKALFMSPAREAFFRDLAGELLTRGWLALDILEGGGRPVAAGFSFVMGDTVYLYNSSLDGDVFSASPGMVLLASLIERSIVDGLRRLDFLKGDERYKFQLGGQPRTLSSVMVMPG